MPERPARTPDFAAWEAEIDLTKDVEQLATIIEEVRHLPHFSESCHLMQYIRLKALLLGADIHKDRRFWLRDEEVAMS